jgi:Tfp pilus assembly protein PilO
MMDFLKGKVLPIDWAINGAVVALTAAVGVAFAFGVVFSGGTKIEETRAKIAKVLDQVKQAKDIYGDHTRRQKQKDDMQKLVDEFKVRLPPEQEIPSLLQTFEGFGADIGLRVNLASLPRISDQRKETIPYQVKAVGNFHQIVLFINRLERYQRYFKVSDLKIGPQQMGVSEAQFTLSTYRFIESPGPVAEGEKK